MRKLLQNTMFVAVTMAGVAAVFYSYDLAIMTGYVPAEITDSSTKDEVATDAGGEDASSNATEDERFLEPWPLPDVVFERR